VANDRILIIDDDRDLWLAYQAVLAAELEEGASARQRLASLLARGRAGQLPQPSYRLDFAAQGQEGYRKILEAVRSHDPYAVAFVDIRMPPGWDGMETAARIRKVDSEIELVIVTAYADRSREEIVKTVGSPDKLLYLRKPFDPEELLQTALSLTEKWKLGRKQEEQRLELQSVLSATAAAIFTVSPQHLLQSWNSAAEKITGFDAIDVIGGPCLFERIVEGGGCRENCPLNGADDLDSGPVELVLIDKGGRRRTVSKSMSLLRDERGSIIKVVEGFWDITALKEAESALQQSEARFRALVETTSDWVWEVDADGCFTYCSPLCEVLYGYFPAELIGQSVFVLLPPEDADAFRELFERCARNLASFQGYERRSVRKDGAIVYIETSGAPYLSDGRIIGFRGIDRDITKRKRNEEERRKLEEQYRQSQKMEALGTLAGGIAHDLNNVLTPIIGNAQLCLLKMPGSSPFQEPCQEIVKGGERAADLLRQILAFSRKQVLTPRHLDLNSLIHNFVKMLRRLIREDIELKLDLADRLWSLYADLGQIEQILINLVVNARDAIAEGGTVTIQTRNEVIAEGRHLVDWDGKAIVGSFVVMTVRDDGMGMDEATLARIFDPFFTTKEVGKGTGLGLSTVYGIVNQHDGFIRVETAPGKGTALHIYFKRSSVAPEVFEKRGTQSVEGGTETILLAEDDLSVRLVTIAALSHYGYQVIEAANGREALRIAATYQGPIDLLLTDIVMPGLGGKAVADSLRQRWPDIPVIFMSGHPAHIAPEELRGAASMFYVQKPFTPHEIAQRVREVLDEKRNAADETKL